MRSVVNEQNIETAFERKRKARATVGQYDPNPLGYKRIAMVKAIGCDSERRSQSPNLYLSSDRGL